MLVAVAAMASVSCQKEEAQAPVEPKSTTLTLHANVEETKTYIDDNTVLWGTGEYVQLYFNNGTDDPQFVKSNADNADVWNASDEAMFSFDITYNPADSYTLGGVYPASVTDGISNSDAANFKLALPSVQNATTSSYDPAAFIMIMKPETIADADFDKDGHIASFRRAVALNKITLTGVKEAINSVAITAEGKDLAGRRKFNLTTGAEGEIYYGQTSTITVNATYAAGDIDVWFTSWGAEIAEGESLKLVMKSATKTYTKTITARAEGIKFVEGDLNKLSIDMSTVVGEVSAQPLPFEKDFSDKTGTTGLTELEGFTISGSVYNASGAIRLAKGSGSGTVTTESLDLSDEFHVIVDATGWDSDEVVMTVSAGEQTNELTLSTYGESSQPGAFVSYVINFEPVGESATVSFTAASGKRVYIQKIQVLAGHAELPPILTVTAPEQMSAEGGNGSFLYTLTNPKDGLELTVSEEADWITDVVDAEGTVTYTVAANNTESPREADITLTYGDLTETVTVSQKGQAASGGGGTSYTLLWSDTETTSGYTSSESSITASDGSVWAIKGYLRNSTNKFIQLGKGGANYITTPVASAPITKITVTCGSSYYLTVCTTDGTELMNKQPGGGSADYDNVVEFDLSSYSYTQVKIISRRNSGTSNAAVYIQSVVVE